MNKVIETELVMEKIRNLAREEVERHKKTMQEYEDKYRTAQKKQRKAAVEA